MRYHGWRTILNYREATALSDVAGVVLGGAHPLSLGEAADALRGKFRVESRNEFLRAIEPSPQLWERLGYQAVWTSGTEIGKILGREDHRSLP